MHVGTEKCVVTFAWSLKQEIYKKKKSHIKNLNKL